MIKRILHTSDWHIGRKLKERDRAEEFQQFFEWLSEIINSEKIDALIVSGDIFDNSTPSSQAQELYYSFLAKVSKSSYCRHIVITSGNHDSASFIDAPSEIMKMCKIHVVGKASDDKSREVIELKDSNGQTELIVCAVPYLYERDLITARKDDTQADRDSRIKAGIISHYEEVFREAAELQKTNDVPVVSMGHLFLEAGITRTDEGEHSLYLGTAIKVGSDIFPENIAYTALGHLHSPQSVGRVNIRYSGSPIALTFGELGVQKSVSIVEFEGKNFKEVKEIPVPVYQIMTRISGDMAEIERKIRNLAELKKSVWVEVTYTGSEIVGDIQERLNEILKDYENNDYENVEVLSIRNETVHEITAHDTEKPLPATLENIKPLEMLEFFFKENEIPKETQEIFTPLYKEILREMELDY